MIRRKARAAQNEIEVLRMQVEALGAEVRRLRQAGPSTLQSDNWQESVSPIPWEVMIHWPGKHLPATETSPLVYWHPGDLDHPDGETPEGWKMVTANKAVLFIKVYSDQRSNVAQSKAFEFLISRDMDGMSLTDVEAYVTDTGGTNNISLRNRFPGLAMLSTNITIDSGEFNSIDAATQPVINAANAQVAHGDHVAIDVNSAGGKGLGCCLTFEYA